MAFMDKLFKKSDEVDIEEFLNNLDVEEEAVYENADAYVKPMQLQRETDVALVMDEAKKGNIVLVNVGDLAKRNAIKLRDLIADLKSQVNSIDGDIARLSQDKVIITPSRVKIIKSKA